MNLFWLILRLIPWLEEERVWFSNWRRFLGKEERPKMEVFRNFICFVFDHDWGGVQESKGDYPNQVCRRCREVREIRVAEDMIQSN